MHLSFHNENYQVFIPFFPACEIKEKTKLFESAPGSRTQSRDDTSKVASWR